MSEGLQDDNILDQSCTIVAVCYSTSVGHHNGCRSCLNDCLCLLGLDSASWLN